MADYRFDLYRNGIKEAELVEIQNITYGYKRNDFVPAIFTYNANNLNSEIRDNLIYGSELRIYRRSDSTESLKLVYAGEIQQPVKENNRDGVKSISVTVDPWTNAYLSKRYITKSFSTTEESAIAWGLINETQTDTKSGTFTTSQVDFGITQGTLETTGNVRDRTYSEGQLLTLLQQLADVQDTAGNPQRVRFFVLSPDFIDNRYLKFNYFASGADKSNSVVYTSPLISNITETTPFTTGSYGNRIIANGQNNIQQIANSTNTAVLDLFKMREKYISSTNITTNAELLERATEELARRENIESVISFSITENDPFTGKYRVGDIIGVEFDDGDIIINKDDDYRVYQILINFDESGIETTEILVAKEKPVTLNNDPTDRLINIVNSSDNRLTNLEK